MEMVEVHLGPVLGGLLVVGLGLRTRVGCRVTPLGSNRIRAAMVFPESLRIEIGAKGLQPAVDVALVEVSRMICGPTDRVLIRQDVTDVTLSAVRLCYTSSSVVVLFAKLMTIGVCPPCFRDAEEEVRRHAITAGGGVEWGRIWRGWISQELTSQLEKGEEEYRKGVLFFFSDR